MNLFQEMEVNYKDFIESANDFMNSCRDFTNNEDTRSIFNMGRRSYKNEIENKIKTKIEELEIEQESNREDLKIAIDNLSLQNIDKIANKISINMSIRGILQSLLEKE